jgi:hypothetical protein
MCGSLDEPLSRTASNGRSSRGPICVEGRRKTTINLSQDSRCPARHSTGHLCRHRFSPACSGPDRAAGVEVNTVVRAKYFPGESSRISPQQLRSVVFLPEIEDRHDTSLRMDASATAVSDVWFQNYELRFFRFCCSSRSYTYQFFTT